MAYFLLVVLATLYGSHLGAGEAPAVEINDETYDADDTGEVDEDIIIDEEDTNEEEGVNNYTQND